MVAQTKGLDIRHERQYHRFSFPATPCLAQSLAYSLTPVFAYPATLLKNCNMAPDIAPCIL